MRCSWPILAGLRFAFLCTVSAVRASAVGAQQDSLPCTNVGVERITTLGKKLYPDLFQEPAPDTAIASYFAVLADRFGNPISVARGTATGKLFSAWDAAPEAFPNDAKRGRVLCTWSFVARKPARPGPAGSPPNDLVIAFVVVAK